MSRRPRGVDLNRNFPSEWRRSTGLEYSGPRPLSEPETRIARALIRRERPDVTIWFHQPQSVVRAWGPSRVMARRYARLAGVPYRTMQWPPGCASRWQNGIGQVSFVVELPPRELADADARRYADAVLRLGE